MADIVQGLWIGDSLGLIERLSIASFQHHGHEYHLYCYNELADVPPGTVLMDGNTILPASAIFSYQQGFGKGSVSAFSNLFRYKLLLEKGGWWVDTDMVCLKAFAFAEAMVFASEATRRGVQVASATIKLPAGHPVAAHCYEAASREDRQALPWGKIGPHLLSRVVRETGLLHLVKKVPTFCPISWWDWHLVLESPHTSDWLPPLQESHAVHLWHEMFRQAGINRQIRFTARSLFAQLLHRYGLEAAFP